MMLAKYSSVVGRTPWSGPDPLVRPFGRRRPARGPAADQGVRPTARFIACVTLAAALLAGCGKAKEKEAAESEAPTPVMIETAVRGAIDRVVTADAVLYPVNQSN